MACLAVVTGCAGFIGSHLCERLLAEGFEVAGIDALTTFYDPHVKRANLGKCLDDTRFRFFDRLISDATLSPLQDAELVFHLAAQPGVRTSWGPQFSSYVQHNIAETQMLLHYLRDSKRLRRLVFASSSSVYGNSSQPLVSEESPKEPFSPYGITKLAAEQLCTAYARNFGVPLMSLRLFPVCGPRQRPDMLLNRLISSALTGAAFPLYGDGKMRREFTSVLDVVDSMLLASHASNPHGAYNISSGHLIPVEEAIRMVEERAGVRLKITRNPQSAGDVSGFAADLRKAQSELGYTPKRQLGEMISAQFEYARGNMRSTAAGRS